MFRRELSICSFTATRESVAVNLNDSPTSDFKVFFGTDGLGSGDIAPQAFIAAFMQ
jgi:hypothetical protein